MENEELDDAELAEEFAKEKSEEIQQVLEKDLAAVHFLIISNILKLDPGEIALYPCSVELNWIYFRIRIRMNEN